MKRRTKTGWTPELREFQRQVCAVADAAKAVPNGIGLLVAGPAFYRKQFAGLVHVGQVGPGDIFIMVHRNAKTRKPRSSAGISITED